MPARRQGGWTTTRANHDNLQTNSNAAGLPLLQPRGSLPSSIQSSVPPCAQPCLQDYISQQYSGCQNNVNLSCLCPKFSSEGYTLGELAFICLQESCSATSETEQQQAYGICVAQTNAMSATHSTLTLPATATSTSSSGVTTTTVEVFATTSGILSTQHPTLATSTRRSSAVGSSVAQSASSVVTPASETPAPSSSIPTPVAATGAPPHGSTDLTSAQAIGVSVAAFGGLALLMLAIWFCACMRRRKGICKSPKSKHSSYDFIDSAPPRFSPFNYGYADPRGPLGGIEGRRAELPSNFPNIIRPTA